LHLPFRNRSQRCKWCRRVFFPLHVLQVATNAQRSTVVSCGWCAVLSMDWTVYDPSIYDRVGFCLWNDVCLWLQYDRCRVEKEPWQRKTKAVRQQQTVRRREMKKPIIYG